MPQETCPANYQVKVPSLFQSMCQGPSQMNSKERTQFNCQSNCQVTSQRPHQFIWQIKSGRYPRGFPRDIQSIIPVSTGFGYSIGYQSVITSDKPTKYTSPVPIIKPSSMPSEIPTKYPSHVPKELQSAKPSNMLIEYPSGYPTDSPNTMTSKNPSSNPSYQRSSGPDVLKKCSQQEQVILQIYIILFILHIISSSSSR